MAIRWRETKSVPPSLAQADIFGGMERDQRLTLVELMNIVDLPGGEYLGKVGQPLPQHMEAESVIWVVESGGLEVLLPVDGEMVVVESIRAGAALGP